MFSTHLALAISLLGLTQSTAAAPSSSHVSVRLPPTLDDGASTANWKTLPVGWDFGYWYQTNSSSSNSFQRNLQYSTLPIDAKKPAGPRSELSSFQITGNETVFTTYGVDTPDAYPSVYNFTGTGILANATDFLEILAWGEDCRGNGYRISYSTLTAFTKTPASLDVLSRSKLGPDNTTLNKIRHALIAFGNQDITKLANAMVPALQDSGRDGQPPLQTCDASCQSNEDLLAIIGSQ